MHDHISFTGQCKKQEVNKKTATLLLATTSSCPVRAQVLQWEKRSTLSRPAPPLQQQQGQQQPPPPPKKKQRHREILNENTPPIQPQQQQQQQPQHHRLPIPSQARLGTNSKSGWQSQSYIQPRVIGRLPVDRTLIKLSVSLIDTYKHINTVYYEERDARRRNKEKKPGGAGGGSGAGGEAGTGTNNNGWDDENFDYIITPGELFFHGRYRIKERIGKGSFGQVVQAEDIESKRQVAIKIIKSKPPFLKQTKTEIELLIHLCQKDPQDQHNIVRLQTHFMYRNHQCLVFEMLSLNLYELLKNTQFRGVSLNLIRKFAKQLLKALSFLARDDVDIIHADLKPENIVLRHPKMSGLKLIDFGSSCRSNKRMYPYIQSRFYRSPEVMLGLPYTAAIDMWSLACILVEMHTGTPLFEGLLDRFDQMQKIVQLLGMVPDCVLEKVTDQVKIQFFDRKMEDGKWQTKSKSKTSSSSSSSAAAAAVAEQASVTEQVPPANKMVVVPSMDPIASLTSVIMTGGTRQKIMSRPPAAISSNNSPRNYELFIDLVYKMLAYDPNERIKPKEALEHPFITDGEI